MRVLFSRGFVYLQKFFGFLFLNENSLGVLFGDAFELAFGVEFEYDGFHDLFYLRVIL